MIRENLCYYLMCDVCKKSFSPATDRREVLDGVLADYFLSKALMLAEAEKAGWRHELMIHGNVTFYCPECYKKRVEEGGSDE